LTVLLAATIAASVSALLAICAAATIWVRSAPKRLVAECQQAQECAAKAEHAAARAVVEVTALRASWLTQQQEMEKYLDSIDSRARRISAVKSQERKRDERETEEDGTVNDPEGMLATLRREAGL